MTETRQKTAIAGLELSPKNVFRNDKGAVLHMLRFEDGHTELPAKEIYFSKVKKGVIKGWKQHLRMNQRFVVPVGEVHFVFYDDRTSSPTKGAIVEITLSEKNYQLLRVPPELWYSFRGDAEGESMICNCATLINDPEEVRTQEVDQFPHFRWL